MITNSPYFEEFRTDGEPLTSRGDLSFLLPPERDVSGETFIDGAEDIKLPRKSAYCKKKASA